MIVFLSLTNLFVIYKKNKKRTVTFAFFGHCIYKYKKGWIYMTYFGESKRFKPNVSMMVKRVIIIVIILAAAGINGFYIYSTRHYFSVERWNASSQNDKQYMIESFKGQYEKLKLSKKEIIEILGNDTESCYGYKCRLKNDNNLVYDFGQKKNMFFKYTGNIALVITFNESEVVQDIAIKYYLW